MKCLDSSFLIDFLNNESGAVKKYLEISNESLLTTTTSVFEVLFGFHRKKVKVQERTIKFNNLLDNIELLELDKNSAALAARISAELINEGKEIELQDCQIAGSMLSKNCNTIITRDLRHYNRIKEIKVESY